MRWVLPIFATIMWAACSTLGPEDAEKAELHLRSGTALMENGHLPQALAELLKAEELDSTNPQIQNNLGLAYFGRGRNDLALKHLRRALELDPKYTDAKNNLGRILIEEQKYADAERYLQEATLDLTFANPEKPLLNLGLSSFRQNQFERAKSYLTKALEYQRKNCFGQTLYGRTLFELKDYSLSSQALDRAVGFCPSGTGDEAQYYGALSYYQTGEKRKAEARLEEIIKLYPDGKYASRARTLLETMRK